jgi:enoyl-[acyl-carrier protein] reductase I
MHLLAQRRGLIVGVANARSLAWHIAEAAHRAGAQLVLTYASERLRAGVAALADSIGAVTAPLDVRDDAQLAAVHQLLEARWGALDFVVHATAFARREELQGRFVQTSRAGFAEALDVSAYALVALAQALRPLLVRGEHPSLLTLTYLGATRAMPSYNVMGVAKAALEACVRYLAADLGPEGIRVNALSAGPVRTLSAAGVHGLRTMLQHVAAHAPLRRSIDGAEVADAALYALSSLGRGTTGEVIHVDAGYHVLGAPGLVPPSVDGTGT